MAATRSHSPPLPPNAAYTHPTITLNILPSATLFTAGTKLTGVLELTCKKPNTVALGQLAVEFVGTEELKLLDHSAQSSIHGPHKCIFQGPALPPSNAVAASEAPIAGHYYTALRGRTKFPFSFPLPSKLPSSTNFGDKARASYALKATCQVLAIDSRQNVLVTKAKTIQIVERLLDWNDNRYHEPVEMRGELRDPSGSGAGVWAELKIPKILHFSLLPDNGLIHAQLTVKNNSRRTLSGGVNAKICRKLVLPHHPAPSAPDPSRIHVVRTSTFRGPEFEFPSGQPKTVSLLCQLPSPAAQDDIPSAISVRALKLFSVDMFLRVELELGALSNDLVIDLPIYVTHPSSLPKELLLRTQPPKTIEHVRSTNAMSLLTKPDGSSGRPSPATAYQDQQFSPYPATPGPSHDPRSHAPYPPPQPLFSPPTTPWHRPPASSPFDPASAYAPATQPGDYHPHSTDMPPIPPAHPQEPFSPAAYHAYDPGSPMPSHWRTRHQSLPAAPGPPSHHYRPPDTHHDAESVFEGALSRKPSSSRRTSEPISPFSGVQPVSGGLVVRKRALPVPPQQQPPAAGPAHPESLSSHHAPGLGSPAPPDPAPGHARLATIGESGESRPGTVRRKTHAVLAGRSADSSSSGEDDGSSGALGARRPARVVSHPHAVRPRRSDGSDSVQALEDFVALEDDQRRCAERARAASSPSPPPSEKPDRTPTLASHHQPGFLPSHPAQTQEHRPPPQPPAEAPLPAERLRSADSRALSSGGLANLVQLLNRAASVEPPPRASSVHDPAPSHADGARSAAQDPEEDGRLGRPPGASSSAATGASALRIKSCRISFAHEALIDAVPSPPPSSTSSPTKPLASVPAPAPACTPENPPVVAAAVARRASVAPAALFAHFDPARPSPSSPPSGAAPASAGPSSLMSPDKPHRKPSVVIPSVSPVVKKKAPRKSPQTRKPSGPAALPAAAADDDCQPSIVDRLRRPNPIPNPGLSPASHRQSPDPPPSQPPPPQPPLSQPPLPQPPLPQHRLSAIPKSAVPLAIPGLSRGLPSSGSGPHRPLPISPGSVHLARLAQAQPPHPMPPQSMPPQAMPPQSMPPQSQPAVQVGVKEPAKPASHLDSPTSPTYLSRKSRIKRQMSSTPNTIDESTILSKRRDSRIGGVSSSEEGGRMFSINRVPGGWNEEESNEIEAQLIEALRQTNLAVHKATHRRLSTPQFVKSPAKSWSSIRSSLYSTSSQIAGVPAPYDRLRASVSIGGRTSEESVGSSVDRAREPPASRASLDWPSTSQTEESAKWFDEDAPIRLTSEEYKSMRGGRGGRVSSVVGQWAKLTAAGDDGQDSPRKKNPETAEQEEQQDIPASVSTRGLSIRPKNISHPSQYSIAGFLSRNASLTSQFSSPRVPAEEPRTDGEPAKLPSAPAFQTPAFAAPRRVLPAVPLSTTATTTMRGDENKGAGAAKQGYRNLANRLSGTAMISRPHQQPPAAPSASSSTSSVSSLADSASLRPHSLDPPRLKPSHRPPAAASRPPPLLRSLNSASNRPFSDLVKRWEA
ncbi:hypothetical protein PtB15_13B274 [Puccinia triticina]|nr:hypothetical protein PtB15_13B274 [Puccinia triticina]